MNIEAAPTPSKPMRILPLHFLLCSEGLNFPEFSGSAWHGGLGKVLARNSPLAFRQLFQTGPESRLYSLLPPMRQQFMKGEMFELRLTLFGHGADHALAVTQAIADLGRIGLRPGGNYLLHEASTLGPDGKITFLSNDEGFIALPKIFGANEFIASHSHTVESCRINFVTPLRIKEGNELLNTVPSYAQLLHRIFSRIDQLTHVTEEAPPLAKNMRGDLYNEAEGVEIKASAIAAHGIERRSSRSEQQMRFGGIVGTVAYAGVMHNTLPWLRLASLVQLGGKTAFGFGGLEIEVASTV